MNENVLSMKLRNCLLVEKQEDFRTSQKKKNLILISQLLCSALWEELFRSEIHNVSGDYPSYATCWPEVICLSQ